MSYYRTPAQKHAFRMRLLVCLPGIPVAVIAGMVASENGYPWLAAVAMLIAALQLAAINTFALTVMVIATVVGAFAVPYLLFGAVGFFVCIVLLWLVTSSMQG